VFKFKFGSISSLWRLAPLFGSVLFVILYFIATLYYPGGSQFDKNSRGFSWTQNYWCNLLNEHGINGQYNPARPIAFIALIDICLTLSWFWYLFPLLVEFKKRGRRIIQVSGFASMAIGMFIFTSLHDLIINIASLFGLAALTGTLIGLWKLKWIKLFWMGLFILVLIGLNNRLYYGKNLMIYLPIVQIFTFLYFLVWICCVTIGLNSNQQMK
jgi:hypothetical protein